jgi:poly(A) polymerase
VPESSDEESDDNSDDADTEDIAQAPEANSDNDDENIDRLVDAEGRILRDNVYGTVDDDVWRRDFTVNALYYNIADFSIWDYVDGAADIAARRLRLIGDPPTRYREDPVRMLRGARFMAKLNFQLDSATAEPIPELRHLLTDVPPARLFDETLKLFLTGLGVASLKTLQQLELLEVLMPSVASILARAPQGPIATLLRAGLKSTDERALAGRPVSPTFLFAILLYGPIAAAIEGAPPQRWHEVGTIVDACDRVTRELTRRISLPKRFSLGVREMFVLQPRLEAPRGRRALRLLEQPRFRAAYDLLLLRAAAGMANTSAAEWWTRLQAAPPQEQLTMCDALGRSAASAGEASSAPLRPRSRRRRGGRWRKSRPDSERS